MSSPTLKVLSTLQAHGVRNLLMGGQAVMRNVPEFDVCWARRSTLAAGDLDAIEVMGLEDLVSCKKTRRDKDWPMLRVLVERNYLDDTLEPTADRFRFWLRDLRTSQLLIECVERARTHSEAAGSVLADVAAHRAATAIAARGGSPEDIEAALAIEETRERVADDACWQPLIRELEALRHAARHSN